MKSWAQRHPLGATALVSTLLFGVAALALHLTTPAPQDRTITLTAKRFAYAPNVIEVNCGDRVTVLLRSLDVHHGSYLDGYEQALELASAGRSW